MYLVPEQNPRLICYVHNGATEDIENSQTVIVYPTGCAHTRIVGVGVVREMPNICTTIILLLCRLCSHRKTNTRRQICVGWSVDYAQYCRCVRRSIGLCPPTHRKFNIQLLVTCIIQSCLLHTRVGGSVGSYRNLSIFLGFGYIRWSSTCSHFLTNMHLCDQSKRSKRRARATAKTKHTQRLCMRAMARHKSKSGTPFAACINDSLTRTTELLGRQELLSSRM